MRVSSVLAALFFLLICSTANRPVHAQEADETAASKTGWQVKIEGQMGEPFEGRLELRKGELFFASIGRMEKGKPTIAVLFGKELPASPRLRVTPYGGYMIGRSEGTFQSVVAGAQIEFECGRFSAGTDILHVKKQVIPKGEFGFEAEGEVLVRAVRRVSVGTFISFDKTRGEPRELKIGPSVHFNLWHRNFSLAVPVSTDGVVRLRGGMEFHLSDLKSFWKGVSAKR